MTDLRASLDGSNSTRWKGWGLRPILLFAAAYTIVGILHELAHALTAYSLHVPSTLFHLGVTLDRAHGTLNERAVIGVAGPLFTFAVGLLCLVAYKKAHDSRLGLPPLYLAMFGMGTFFGNLMSASFVGDFSRAALALQVPMPVRYGTSAVGILLLCGLSFLIGMELRRWAPAGVSAGRAMTGMIALPAILGTAMVVLIFLPMPSAFAYARIAESSFWIAAAVGTLISRKHPPESKRDLGLAWADLVLFLVPVFVVRVMVGGITFSP